MREPVNRTILLFDIERFSRRDDVVQAVLRRSLNKIVDETLEAAGVEATQQYREDRGDGLIVLLSGDVAKTVLLRTLVTTTPELLHEHNLLASDSAQMRLRIVLAVGEVAHDPHAGTTGGLVGHDLNQACRLLDADVLRSALAARRDEHCVLAVSAPVYEGVVRHGHRGVRPELFRHTDVTVKDGTLPAWIHQGASTHRPPTARGSAPAAAPEAAPAQAAPARAAEPAGAPAAGRTPPAAPAERPPGAVFHFHGAPVIHGSLVGGDQHGVSGGHVTGDVVLGGTRTEDDTTDGSRR
ncbi:hypothetical protein [Streptomyces capillispiralis]|uniref:Guanylate cyclase domain-containing protein n=1 Tax=Streptomyces capillispiralis TaxID=68182 RepID=A0A561T9J2_9ACTN|nr:hypothetical protein [Streptomyces capillispiralis]TWF83779.1 hypothetical protein FHX78_11709 [Streptomyces capillispiralis]GHH91425.1 hypothetical protein GCM10017779_18820 [Streptomyces capillispiralis]